MQCKSAFPWQMEDHYLKYSLVQSGQLSSTMMTPLNISCSHFSLLHRCYNSQHPFKNRDVGTKIALLTPRGHAIPTVPSYISSSTTCTTWTHHSPYIKSHIHPSHTTQGPKPRMERGPSSCWPALLSRKGIRPHGKSPEREERLYLSHLVSSISHFSARLILVSS